MVLEGRLQTRLFSLRSMNVILSRLQNSHQKAGRDRANDRQSYHVPVAVSAIRFHILWLFNTRMNAPVHAWLGDGFEEALASI